MMKFNLKESIAETINEKKEIWKKESEGFGDTFAKITKTVGIEPCEECEERRKDWNQRLSYKKK